MPSEVAVERMAQCSCGAVRIVAVGEPQSVVVCHCVDCQKRTGSAFGVGAYYAQEDVRISGDTTEFVRPTDAGNQFITRFCPQCGSSLYWRSGKNPGLVGVAVGAFADASFPPPVRSVWEQSMHDWVRMDAVAAHFPKGRVS